MSAKTNLRQELFAKEYVIDLNATRAAISAGYSESTASEIGSKLLRNTKVKRRIEALIAKRLSKLEISGDKVLERYEAMAEGNIADFITIEPDGTARVDVSNKSRAALYAVQKLSTDTYVTGAGNSKRVVTTVKLELADRLKANESLAKYKRLFADVTIGAHESLATVLAAGRQRVVAAAQPPALPAPEIIPEPVAPEPAPALVEPVVDVKPLAASVPSQTSTKTAPLAGEMSAEDRNRAFFDFTTGRVLNV